MSRLATVLRVQHSMRLHHAQRARRQAARNAPKPRWPNKERLQYYAVLVAMLERVYAVIRRDVVPKLPAILDTHNITRPEPAPIRFDATGRDVEGVIAELDIDIGEEIPETLIEMEAQKHVLRVTAQQGAELQKQIQRVANINLYDDNAGLAEHLEIATADNVRLIKDLTSSQSSDMQALLTSAARQGLHHSVVAEQIEERFGMAKRRARLIANDQTGKLNGELNSIRQQNLGIRRYRWSTSKDERVRPGHRALEGTIQDWTKPPVVDQRTGARAHPGQPVRCRCQAIPIIDDVLVEAGLMDPDEVELQQPARRPPTPLPPIPPTIPQPPPANVPGRRRPRT